VDANQASASHCHLRFGWSGFRSVIVAPSAVERRPMYLVVVGDRHLFFWTDPRAHGCTHPVGEGADFIDLPRRDDHWKWGGSIPRDDMHPHVLARSRRQPTKFKAFRSELDVSNSWEILDGVAEVWSTWEAFSRLTVLDGTHEVLDGNESVK
jgi:hypothetical protein